MGNGYAFAFEAVRFSRYYGCLCLDIQDVCERQGRVTGMPSCSPGESKYEGRINAGRGSFYKPSDPDLPTWPKALGCVGFRRWRSSFLRARLPQLPDPCSPSLLLRPTFIPAPGTNPSLRSYLGPSKGPCLFGLISTPRLATICDKRLPSKANNTELEDINISPQPPRGTAHSQPRVKGERCGLTNPGSLRTGP